MASSCRLYIFKEVKGSVVMVSERTPACCRGLCELCCGRGCGFCIGPLRRYQEAFAAGRYIPTLQVSNYMNHEAIVQVMPSHKCDRHYCMRRGVEGPVSMRCWQWLEVTYSPKWNTLACLAQT